MWENTFCCCCCATFISCPIVETSLKDATTSCGSFLQFKVYCQTLRSSLSDLIREREWKLGLCHSERKEKKAFVVSHQIEQTFSFEVFCSNWSLVYLWRKKSCPLLLFISLSLKEDILCFFCRLFFRKFRESCWKKYVWSCLQTCCCQNISL